MACPRRRGLCPGRPSPPLHRPLPPAAGCAFPAPLLLRDRRRPVVTPFVAVTLCRLLTVCVPPRPPTRGRPRCLYTRRLNSSSRRRLPGLYPSEQPPTWGSGAGFRLPTGGREGRPRRSRRPRPQSLGQRVTPLGAARNRGPAHPPGASRALPRGTPSRAGRVGWGGAGPARR